MGTEARKGTFKVESLKEIERKIQARWEENRAFEENAPDTPQEKFMVPFAYFKRNILEIRMNPTVGLTVHGLWTKGGSH